MNVKTIREWAEFCADDTIRQKWIDNANAQDCIKWRENTIQSDITYALLRSFDWEESPQGFDYWNDIFVDMHNNLEKYLKKRKKMFHYE